MKAVILVALTALFALGVPLKDTRAGEKGDGSAVFGMWQWIHLNDKGEIDDKGPCAPESSGLVISVDTHKQNELSRRHVLSIAEGTDERPSNDVFTATRTEDGKPAGTYAYDGTKSPPRMSISDIPGGGNPKLVMKCQ